MGTHQRIKTVTKTVLLSVSYIALAAATASQVRAQATPPTEQAPATPSPTAPSDATPSPPAAPAQQAPSTSPDASSSPPATPAQQPSADQPNAAPLSQVTVNPAPRKPQQRTSVAQVSRPSAPPPSAPPPSAIQLAWPSSATQDARTGTVGIYANSTSVATKVNTPIVNIPQSLTVVTREFINDTSFQNLTDITRFVPGVAIHQGEGNRDELVIRGVDSSANFFVNGFRDDVQIFRDLYNTQSLEVLKGPSALIFGRGAGGGLVNRTLKEADWTTIREVTGQTGSWFDRRVAVDVGQGINENVAARFNAFYEASDTFRDFGHLERYGINPTVTLKPSDDTKVKLSYEFYHDFRLADRGNPSQG